MATNCLSVFDHFVKLALKGIRYWGLKESRTSYQQRISFTDNQWQNILQKVRKSSKCGKDQKTFKDVVSLIVDGESI